MKEIVLKKKKALFLNFPVGAAVGSHCWQEAQHQGQCLIRALPEQPKQPHCLGVSHCLSWHQPSFRNMGPYSHIFSGAEDWGRVAGLHSVLINKEKQLVLSSSLSELI